MGIQILQEVVDSSLHGNDAKSQLEINFEIALKIKYQEKLMKKFLYTCILLGLTACFATTPNKTPRELENVTFIDTTVFDKDLKDSMSAQIATITVTPIGTLSVNQIPERLSKWLGAISDKNGRVEIEPKMEGARSLSLLVSLLPLTFQYLQNESSYGLAGNYDVTIFYEPETGTVKKVVFTKR